MTPKYVLAFIAVAFVAACEDTSNADIDPSLAPLGAVDSIETVPPPPESTQEIDVSPMPQDDFKDTEDRVFFDVDQYVLSTPAKLILDRQAEFLLNNPSYNVTIEGHADERGTREYNLALGARRAQSVQDYFMSLGIAQNRLSTLSFGKERPEETCSAEACYAKNRRAVLVVLADGLG